MSKKTSPVIVINKKIIKSKAFRELKTASSILVYLDFLSKRQMKKIKHKSKSDGWIITNNGKIEYTYTEALKKGFTRPRFRGALDELIAKGFIDVTHRGGAYDRDKSLYSISTRWEKYGKEDFELVIREKDTRRGRGFSVVHSRKKEKCKVEQISKPKNKLKKAS